MHGSDLYEISDNLSEDGSVKIKESKNKKKLSMRRASSSLMTIKEWFKHLT